MFSIIWLMITALLGCVFGLSIVTATIGDRVEKHRIPPLEMKLELGDISPASIVAAQSVQGLAGIYSMGEEFHVKQQGRGERFQQYAAHHILRRGGFANIVEDPYHPRWNIHVLHAVMPPPLVEEFRALQSADFAGVQAWIDDQPGAATLHDAYPPDQWQAVRILITGPHVDVGPFHGYAGDVTGFSIAAAIITGLLFIIMAVVSIAVRRDIADDVRKICGKKRGG